MRYDFDTACQAGSEGSIKWAAMRKSKKEIMDDAVPLTVADMEFMTAPEIREGIKRYVDTQMLGYTAPTAAYYDAVRQWMQTRHGFEVPKGSVAVSPGVVTALYMAVRAFTRPGDGVIIMPPVYHPFYSAVEDNDRRLVCSPLRQGEKGWEIDFADLAKKAGPKDVKMLLLCSPHNPVGRVWEKGELAELAEICAQNDVLVVSDEIHHDLVMPGHTHTVFGTLPGGAGQRSIICTAPSKTFNLAGLQTSGIIITDEKLRRGFEQELRKNAFFTLNAIGIKACEIAYTQCAPWLEQLLRVVDENRRYANSFVAAHMPEINIADLQGTYLQWYDFRGLDVPLEKLSQALHAHDLFFSEGAGFGEQGRGFYRVNIACPKSVLDAALRRLKQAVGSLRK